jgi:hypothetical protein
VVNFIFLLFVKKRGCVKRLLSLTQKKNQINFRIASQIQ